MHDDREGWDQDYWDLYDFMHDPPGGHPKKTSPVPFIVFAVVIVLLLLVGGSAVATPIAWIGIILLLLFRFMGWV